MSVTPLRQPAPLPPVRYFYWLERTEHRRVVLRCPRGHVFTLRHVQLHDAHYGHIDVRCHYVDPSAPASTLPCDALLIVVAVARATKRLVAEVSREDLEFLESAALLPHAELAYLLSTPVRGRVGSG